MSQPRRDNGEGTRPRQRTDGRWEARLRYTDSDGLAKRVSLYGRTKKEVQQKIGDARVRLADGAPAIDSNSTVAEWARLWISTGLAASARRPSTKMDYEIFLRLHVVPTRLGAVPLAKVKPTVVEAWLMELREREKPLSERSILKAFQVLSVLFEAAVRDDLRRTNPCARAAKPKPPRSEGTIATKAELDLLLEVASDTRLFAMWLVIASTGVRKGEALALTWDHVDLDGARIRISQSTTRTPGGIKVGDTKTDAGRRWVPIPAHVVENLIRHRKRQAAEQLLAGELWAADSDWVFTTNVGTRVDPRNALREWARLKHLAGVERKLTIQHLRHTATTAMVNGHVPLKTAAQILGHRDERVTLAVYTHCTPESQRFAAEVLGALTAPSPKREGAV